MGYPDSQDDTDQTAVAAHILDWTEVVDHILDWMEAVADHNLGWKEVVADHMGWLERGCTVGERHFHQLIWVEAHPHPGPTLFPIMSTFMKISCHISELSSSYLCCCLQRLGWLGRS